MAMDDPLTTGPAPQRLEAWLREAVEGYQGPAMVSRFAGGQSNPTFKLETPKASYVLRRKPIGMTLPSAHAVDREFRVLKALAGSKVPVPRVHALCLDPEPAGNAFYVMDMVAGRVFWDPRLPEVSNADRAKIFASMNQVMAEIHSLDPALVGLDDYGRNSDYIARQIALWTKQYRAAELAPIPAMEALIDWLPQNAPAEGAVRLVHGDYRLDNVLIHPTEPRIIAVLDWELSTLGDPRADFAYHVMTWRLAPSLFRGLGGVDLAALSIPSEAAYVADWSRKTGFDAQKDWDFFLGLSMFRIAAILQGVAHRAAHGSAANADAAEVGARAAPVAARALAIIEGRG